MGQRLSQRSGRSNRVIRGGIALAAAYAFVIQAMLFGLIGAQFAASPTDHAAAGFELCLTAQDGSGQSNAPAGPHHADHCVLCFAGAHHLAMGTGGNPSSAVYDSNTRGTTLAIAVHALPRSTFAYAIARPRGPPIDV